MAEVQSGDNLPKKASGFLRREAALLHQVVEKLSSRNVFQDKVPGAETIVQCIEMKQVQALG